MTRHLTMAAARILRTPWTRFRIWRLERRAWSLYAANLKEFESVDCAASLGPVALIRVSRRENETHLIYAEIKRLERTL